MNIRTALELGAAIRERRRQLNLDQDRLAKIVGVSRKWIIDVEKGKTRAEIGLILRTLDALGISVSLDTTETGVSGANTPDAIETPDIDSVLDRTRDRR
ncbi:MULTISPECIES: helix-turn-helix domain-containing protein [Methylosinus]|uniref:Transcriptional regulator n=1 Tax=Methylosinus trichosporium (strain ATCC 35070 / NCIMB 11131 / UNIQEM 75 / OB3b) TaxID=595536 RepID=A0A2D2D1S7_METT3|nr:MULTISPECIES: helix-turn-helix domain-containing protein [Methylosinus]ATQ68961.1 transcriptional regulator [Methylosinus trichosporium OB3b]